MFRPKVQGQVALRHLRLGFHAAWPARENRTSLSILFKKTESVPHNLVIQDPFPDDFRFQGRELADLEAIDRAFGQTHRLQTHDAEATHGRLLDQERDVLEVEFRTLRIFVNLHKIPAIWLKADVFAFVIVIVHETPF
jgi:hypothetical protein